MRVAVKNLPVKTEEKEIREYFSKKWHVTDVYMLKNSRGMFRRVAFVGFTTPEDANSAIKYFNGAMFNNHKIGLEIARGKDAEEKPRGESSLRKILYSKTVYVRGILPGVSTDALRSELSKIGKLSSLELKQANKHLGAVVKFAEGDSALWAAKNLKVLAGMRVYVGAYNEDLHSTKREYYNSLFFTFDAVLKRASEMIKLDKKDIVDVTDSALGSRMAIMETTLVEQTKQFLGQHGINMSAITNEVNKKVLIIRCADILGAIDIVQKRCKVEISPTRCLALLEFENEEDASKTRNSLNLRRHKSHIIYCENAPLCDNATSLDGSTCVYNKVGSVPNSKTNKIVIKNVPFQATVEDLRSIFADSFKVINVRIPLKDGTMHRGFAFLTLDSPKSVNEAIERFGTNTHLFGRRLVLERAKE